MLSLESLCDNCVTVTVTDICGGCFGDRFQRNGQAALAAGSQDARAGRGDIEGMARGGMASNRQT